jgi:hypothetical protein
MLPPMPHTWLHRCVDWLQASSAGQSLWMLQPQLPVGRHWKPDELPVQLALVAHWQLPLDGQAKPAPQLAHTPPDCPHSACVVPGAHSFETGSQQPPLHT